MKYGLIAARMQVPAGTGLWPAFWMLGDDINAVGWPRSGEIDIMEALGQDPSVVRATIHGPAGASGYAHGHSFDTGRALTAGFHTYEISWSPNSITWLLDGVPYWSITSSALAPGQAWVFDQPFHFVLNLAVGGDYPGPPNALTPFPATLLVDWVRMYGSA